MEIKYSLNQIEDVANKLITNAKSKVLLFKGEMGVGKTTLIKSIVKALGSQDEVSSPTFSIVNEYEADHGIIYHFDLYRIKDIEEAYNFGIEDYLDSDSWILIEWPEKIKSILPGNSAVVELNIASKSNRFLRFLN